MYVSNEREREGAKENTNNDLSSRIDFNKRGEHDTLRFTHTHSHCIKKEEIFYIFVKHIARQQSNESKTNTRNENLFMRFCWNYSHRCSFLICSSDERRK